MIDFHSHILPCIDDGSKSVEESLEMLKALTEQGVDTVCATPHFYPSENYPDKFLHLRQRMYEKLKNAIPANEKYPKILLGAEVAYYPGISRMVQLPQMKLEGTKILLLEMPLAKWSDYMVGEVLDIALSGQITVILAHIERYYKMQSRVIWDAFRENGVLMQVNAASFVNPKTRRLAMKILKRGELHLLGSDCHNMGERAPQLAEAVNIIKSKLGEEPIKKIEHLGNRLVNVN